MSLASWSSVAAVVLAALAGLLLTDARPRSTLDRLARPDRPDGSRPPPRPRDRWAPGRALVGSAGRRRDRAGAAAGRALVGELLDGLVAELRSGADPAPALAAAARALPRLDALVRAADRPTGDVAGALERLGTAPGASTAVDLAVTWRVVEQAGAGLAEPAERLLEVHRGEERVRGEVAAQLAGATATAHLLTALPVAGVAMGAALGADPVGFLTGTPPGVACLGAGTGLVMAGRRWTRAITSSVTDVRTGP